MKKILIFFIYIVSLNKIMAMTPSNIKGALIFKYPDQYSNPILIGKGAEREVWGTNANNLAVKGTESKTLCGKYTNEYKILKELQNAIARYNRDIYFTKRANFPKPNKLEIVNLTCLLFMERLYPIKESVSGYLTQLYLRYRTYNQSEVAGAEIKGEFIGYEETEKIVNLYPKINSSVSNIQQLCYDLGKLTAIMHLGAKVDGLGSQIALAKQAPKSNYYKIYIFSFFQSNSLAKYFTRTTTTNIEKIVDKLFDAMTSDYYYPMPNVPGFPNFRKGYLDFAQSISRTSNRAIYTTIANKLFEKYINRWIKEYLLSYYLRENKFLNENFYNYYRAIVDDQKVLEGIQHEITNALRIKNWYVDEDNQYNNRELYNKIDAKLVQLLSATDISDIANKLKLRKSYPR